MLSDEERKIETLKKYINSQEQKMNDYYKIDEEFYKDEIEQLEFSIKLLRYILNLIEKQQKEIEEYKKQLDLDYVDKHFVPVERYNQLEKEIEELKKPKYLLNAKTGEITTINNSEFISKDKIKAKILECRKILYSFEKELELKANKEKYIHKESMNCLLSQISILQSLLEKE